MIDVVIDRLNKHSLNVDKIKTAENLWAINFAFSGNTYDILVLPDSEQTLICCNHHAVFQYPKDVNRLRFDLKELGSIDIEYFLNYINENYSYSTTA